MLQLYACLEIIDFTGEPLTDQEMTSLHYDRLKSLQVCHSLNRILQRIFSPSLIQCELPYSFIQAISIVPLSKSTTTQKRSRHSMDIVPEFHAKAPQATASERTCPRSLCGG